MTKRKDIKGQRFGKLVALYPTEKPRIDIQFGNANVIVEIYVKYH